MSDNYSIATFSSVPTVFKVQEQENISWWLEQRQQPTAGVNKENTIC